MDGRSNRRNKAVFSNFSNVAWKGPQLKKNGLLNLSAVVWRRRAQCKHLETGTHNMRFFFRTHGQADVSHEQAFLEQNC